MPWLAALPASPVFVFNATNLGSGKLVRFTRDGVADWRVGRAREPGLHLAAAVAASAAFPPFLSPYLLNLRGAEWTDEEGNDLANADYRDELALTDGGVYDNLGLETAWKRCHTLCVSDAGGALSADPDRHGTGPSTCSGSPRCWTTRSATPHSPTHHHSSTASPIAGAGATSTSSRTRCGISPRPRSPGASAITIHWGRVRDRVSPEFATSGSHGRRVVWPFEQLSGVNSAHKAGSACEQVGVGSRPTPRWSWRVADTFGVPRLILAAERPTH